MVEPTESDRNAARQFYGHPDHGALREALTQVLAIVRAEGRREAIEALREPTDAMRVAAIEALAAHWRQILADNPTIGDHPTRIFCSSVGSRETDVVWHAMINAFADQTETKDNTPC